MTLSTTRRAKTGRKRCCLKDEIDEKNAQTNEKTNRFGLKRGPDAKAACQAAEALGHLLQGSALTGLPPEPHGARAAGSPAAAPGGRLGPVARLHGVAHPLQEVPRTRHRTAAWPVRLCDGARRGEGGATPGDGVEPLVHAGTLRVAAAAVPRPAGTGGLRGGTRRSGRAHMVASQFYNGHFFHVCNISSANCTIILL